MDPFDLDPKSNPESAPYSSGAHQRLSFVPPPEPEAPAYASIEERAKALAVDALVWLGALLLFAVIFAGISSANGLLWINVGGPPILMATVVWLVYMILTEAKYGASVGKSARGLRVVMEDGAPLTVEAALVRNLVRFLDAAPYVVPYLVAYLAVSNSPKQQRFGDRVAETIVVVAAPTTDPT